MQLKELGLDDQMKGMPSPLIKLDEITKVLKYPDLVAKGDAAAIAKATSIHTTASALLDLTAHVVKNARVEEVLKARGLLGVRDRLQSIASGNAAHTGALAPGRPHQPSDATCAPGPLPRALPCVLPGGDNWPVAGQDDEQEQGPAGMDEAAAAPSQAPRHAKAAPRIKFEGELAYLNSLSKEEQAKARKRIAQERQRAAQPGVRAAEFERRAEHRKDDPVKLSKQCTQVQDSKRRKRDRKEAEAGVEDEAG